MEGLLLSRATRLLVANMFSFFLVSIFSKLLLSFVRGNFLSLALASAGHYPILLFDSVMHYPYRSPLGQVVEFADVNRKRQRASTKPGGQSPSSSNQITPGIEAKKVLWRLA